MSSGIKKLVPQALHQLVNNYWADWQQACAENTLDPEEGFDVPVLGKVWACSDFVAQLCIRNPGLIQGLLAEDIRIDRTLEDYRRIVDESLAGTVQNDEGLMLALRQLRQKEMLRIAWRDLSGLAGVEQILYALTNLAEAIVTRTLRHIETEAAKIFGQPRDSAGIEQSMLVLAMGKMGGCELNFSSDIDLIFAYAEEGETPGPRRTSHHEYFLFVARKLIRYLNEVTADGFVYRVDTRLRPNGASGPLVMSFSGMEQYYQLQGRNWERYALVKARIISGEAEHRNTLQSMLTPFIFRRYLDYSAFDSIREMKSMISAQVKRKGMKNNIKLGRGGIREIEFIGQTFQLLRGGREPELRVRSIIAVLSLLADKGYLSLQACDDLTSAYWFLRRLENRLQMQRDQQTHTLPEDLLMQSRLALSMACEDWSQLSQNIDEKRQQVDRIFSQLIAADETTDNSDGGKVCYESLFLFWNDTENTDALAACLQTTGYQQVETVLKQLVIFRQSAQISRLPEETRQWLIHLIAHFLNAVTRYNSAECLLERILAILLSISGRMVYISMLNEYPALREQLVRVCSAGDWFADNIARYPLLLDSMLNTEELFLPEQDTGALLQQQLQQIGKEHVDALLEEQMDRMRQFKRQQVFKTAVLDIFYELPVEGVSDQLTETADVLLQQVLKLAWESMVERHGEPQCIVDGQVYFPALGVIAYGKLGGHELGYGSDLDIIFLHDSKGEKQQTSGEKSLNNPYFFARVAQRVIHMLGTQTYSGKLYEVDTRLRPDGKSGLMVSSLQAFETYQNEKAWTWEHQALIRARFVTGSTHIEQEFDRIRCSVLARQRNDVALLGDVVAMREKMRRHLANKGAEFDIKHDAGGLVDIEFMTQAGVLLNAGQQADCITETATLALIKNLGGLGWYTADEVDSVSSAYRYFRRLKNRDDLQCDADRREVNKHRNNVVAVWQRLMPDASET